MLTCVILDDEQGAIDSLVYKIGLCDRELRVISTFVNPKKALDEISGLNFDLLFLDVEMPEIDGFDVLDRLKERSFNVIFVTGHHDHVLRALRCSALDYLTKPVNLDDLNGALNKAKRQKLSTDFDELYKLFKHNMQTNSNKKIALPTSEAIVFVNETEIVYCNSSSNYTHIYYKDGTSILVAKTLKSIEELLSREFIRVHHSYIVRKDAVLSYHRGSGGSLKMTTGVIIPVAKSRKDFVLNELNI